MLVSSLPPPAQAVDCINYFCTCNKQLGNRCCYNQINISYCDVATRREIEHRENSWTDTVLGGCAQSFSCFCFYAIFFCLSLLVASSFASLVSLSRTFMKGELVMVETAWAFHAITLCYASVSLLLLILSDPFQRQVQSFSLIGFV